MKHAKHANKRKVYHIVEGTFVQFLSWGKLYQLLESSCYGFYWRHAKDDESCTCRLICCCVVSLFIWLYLAFSKTAKKLCAWQISSFALASSRRTPFLHLQCLNSWSTFETSSIVRDEKFPSVFSDPKLLVQVALASFRSFQKRFSQLDFSNLSRIEAIIIKLLKTWYTFSGSRLWAGIYVYQIQNI